MTIGNVLGKSRQYENKKEEKMDQAIINSVKSQPSGQPHIKKDKIQ